MGLRCCCKDTCWIEFRFIVFGDVNDYIDLSLVISIHSDSLMLHVFLIFNKAPFGPHSCTCPSLLAFYLSYWYRFPVMILVYISVKYIVFKHLFLLFLLDMMIMRRWKLLMIRDLFKVFCFSTNLSWSSIHKTSSVAPLVKY